MVARRAPCAGPPWRVAVHDARPTEASILSSFTSQSHLTILSYRYLDKTKVMYAKFRSVPSRSDFSGARRVKLSRRHCAELDSALVLQTQWKWPTANVDVDHSLSFRFPSAVYLFIFFRLSPFKKLVPISCPAE